jgi:integrase
LSRFILSEYELKDYPLNRLDASFIDAYDYYLRVDAGLSANSMVKHIVHLKKMVTRAMNQKTILYDPFPDYELKKPKSKYLHISKERLEKIMTAPIKSKSVGFIRDMFVFSCFTGLAYADICQVSEKHLHKKPDGSVWIEIPRYKTDVECNIRLLDIPVAIIEKYRPIRNGEHLFKLPNSGALSRAMRKIEEICGIEHLHFHMARHTFATLICLNNGVSMKTLSKLMGHTTMRFTKKYGEVTNQRVGAEMKKLAKPSKKKKRGRVIKMRPEIYSGEN